MNFDINFLGLVWLFWKRAEFWRGWCFWYLKGSFDVNLLGLVWLFWKRTKFWIGLVLLDFKYFFYGECWGSF